MVSLGDESRRSGGFFFDQPSTYSMESDELLIDPSLGPHEEVQFKSIHTPWVVILLLLSTVCLEVAAFLVPSLCHTSDCGISSLSTVVFCNAGLWFLFMLADRYMRYQHYLSRTNGYLEFYRQTRNIRRIPFMILSGGNSMLLILITSLHEFCRPEGTITKETDTCGSLPLTKCNYIQILVSLEVALVIPILIYYLVKAIQFNRQKPQPDINRDDAMTFLQVTNTHTPDIGFRDETYIDDVLEKQADMIRYLRQHNAHLSKKILHLTTQLTLSQSS